MKVGDVVWRRASYKGYHGRQLVRIVRLLQRTAVLEILQDARNPEQCGTRCRSQKCELETTND